MRTRNGIATNVSASDGADPTWKGRFTPTLSRYCPTRPRGRSPSATQCHRRPAARRAAAAPARARRAPAGIHDPRLHEHERNTEHDRDPGRDNEVSSDSRTACRVSCSPSALHTDDHGARQSNPSSGTANSSATSAAPTTKTPGGRARAAVSVREALARGRNPSPRRAPAVGMCAFGAECSRSVTTAPTRSRKRCTARADSRRHSASARSKPSPFGRRPARRTPARAALAGERPSPKSHARRDRTGAIFRRNAVRTSRTCSTGVPSQHAPRGAAVARHSHDGASRPAPALGFTALLDQPPLGQRCERPVDESATRPSTPGRAHRRARARVRSQSRASDPRRQCPTPPSPSATGLLASTTARDRIPCATILPMAKTPTARALVLDAPRQLRERSLALPDVGDDDALLRVEACGLCGTDHEQYTGELFPGFAFVPGHETVGIIERIGDGAAARWASAPASGSRSRSFSRVALASRAGRALPALRTPRAGRHVRMHSRRTRAGAVGWLRAASISCARLAAASGSRDTRPRTCDLVQSRRRGDPVGGYVARNATRRHRRGARSRSARAGGVRGGEAGGCDVRDGHRSRGARPTTTRTRRRVRRRPRGRRRQR